MRFGFKDQAMTMRRNGVNEALTINDSRKLINSETMDQVRARIVSESFQQKTSDKDTTQSRKRQLKSHATKKTVHKTDE